MLYEITATPPARTMKLDSFAKVLEVCEREAVHTNITLQPHNGHWHVTIEYPHESHSIRIRGEEAAHIAALEFEKNGWTHVGVAPFNVLHMADMAESIIERLSVFGPVQTGVVKMRLNEEYGKYAQ